MLQINQTHDYCKHGVPSETVYLLLWAQAGSVVCVVEAAVCQVQGG